MEIMRIILAIIFGGALVTVLYENYYERKEKKLGKLLAPKLEYLIEMSSVQISKKQNELKRSLTEDEKNKILDKCYNEIEIKEFC